MKFLMLAVMAAAVAAPALAQPSSSTTMSNGMSSSNGMSASSSAAPATGGSAAGAANNPAMAKVMTTCKADFAKACPGKAGPEMQSCVRDNFSSLSEPCQGAIMEMMQSRGGG